MPWRGTLRPVPDRGILSGEQNFQGRVQDQQRGRQPAPVHGLRRGRLYDHVRQGRTDGTYADIDRASTFFIIGSNTSEAHPVLFRRIARRKQNEPGVKIIVADPRRTNTSRIADLHIAFRPGTDLALMNGMAWVILHEELDNPRFYNKYAIFKTNDGKDATFDDYRAFLETIRRTR